MRLLWAKLLFKECREIIAILSQILGWTRWGKWELYLVQQASLRECVLASSLCSSPDSGKSHPQILDIALSTRSMGFVLEFLCSSCWPCSQAAQTQIQFGLTIIYDLLVLQGRIHYAHLPICMGICILREHGVWGLLKNVGPRASCIWWVSIKRQLLGTKSQLKSCPAGSHEDWIQGFPFLKL